MYNLIKTSDRHGFSSADATQAGEGKLQVKVMHAGQVIPSHISEARSGEYKVDFTPQGAGQYKVSVYMNDMEVKGKFSFLPCDL